MKCIYCGFYDSKVVDSRSNAENNSIRRRRECLNCGKRWTTYEAIESAPVLVIKKNGSIQPFDKSKIITSLIKACEKRPVGIDEIEQIAEEIESNLKDGLAKEIRSLKIGDMVMDMLKPIDEVSYIRYASVYRQFSKGQDFIDFISNM